MKELFKGPDPQFTSVTYPVCTPAKLLKINLELMHEKSLDQDLCVCVNSFYMNLLSIYFPCLSTSPTL